MMTKLMEKVYSIEEMVAVLRANGDKTNLLECFESLWLIKIFLYSILLSFNTFIIFIFIFIIKK